MNKSFTLIELLIVIAIIAIIASAILVVINPALRLGQANDSRRFSEVRSISTAVSTYIVDNKGKIPYCGGSSGYELPADGIYRWLGTSGAGGTDYISQAQAAWLMDTDPLTGPPDVPDDTGNNHDGTLESAGAGIRPTWIPIQSSAGVVGAYEFQNVSKTEGGYIRILDNNNDYLEPLPDFTVSAWAKFYDVAGEEQGIVSKTENYASYALRLNHSDGDRKIGVKLEWDETDQFLIKSPTLVENNQWYYLTAVKEGTSLRLYLNSKLENTLESVSMNTNAYDLFIGGDPRSSSPGILNYAFEGMIDEVAIFNTAFSEDQIKDIYLYGLTGDWLFCDLAENLVTDGGYLSKIPEDPTNGDLNGIGNSGYMIKRDPTGAVSVKAPHASQYSEQEIMVSR